MQESILLTISRDDLQSLMLTTLEIHDKRRSQATDKVQTVSINQAAKLIGISHESAKNLIRKGKLKTTADQRRIIKASINDYLQA